MTIPVGDKEIIESLEVADNEIIIYDQFRRSFFYRFFFAAN